MCHTQHQSMKAPTAIPAENLRIAHGDTQPSKGRTTPSYCFRLSMDEIYREQNRSARHGISTLLSPKVAVCMSRELIVDHAYSEPGIM